MRTPLVVPPRVRRGDTVAVVSPSYGAVGAWPHRAAAGTAYLESLGLRVRMMPNAARNDGWASAPAEARAEDLHAAFLDPDVAVVLCSIGGDHANAVLPHLDLDLVRAHPKIFQGYSDITVLHWAFLRGAGLRTFHGPALAPELGEHPAPLPLTDRSLRAAWFGAEPPVFEPADRWTDELLDWDRQEDRRRPRALEPAAGWTTLNDGVAEGPLLGGCLETIAWHLQSAERWVDPFGTILVLETSEEAPSAATVDSMLTDLEHLGAFDGAAGIVLGRPYGYTDEGRLALHELVAERARRAGIPALADVDIGHADPMLTLPLGARARLDAGARSFRMLEPATAA